MALALYAAASTGCSLLRRAGHPEQLEELQHRISEGEVGALCIYPKSSRFVVVLDPRKYPKELLRCFPAGIVNRVSNEPDTPPPYYAAHFEAVFASDASREQVHAASRHERIRYLVARAEAVPLRSRSVGLVTVAQALHWLDLPEFYAEARRVLRPGGTLVAWTYGRQRVDAGPLDGVVDDFYHRVIGPYWSPERRWVETGYRTLPFPFEEISMEVPPMVARWSLAELLGYIGTWSAVALCREATGRDPLPELAARLLPLWGDPSTVRTVEWTICVRAGR